MESLEDLRKSIDNIDIAKVVVNHEQIAKAI